MSREHVLTFLIALSSLLMVYSAFHVANRDANRYLEERFEANRQLWECRDRLADKKDTEAELEKMKKALNACWDRHRGGVERRLGMDPADGPGRGDGEG